MGEDTATRELLKELRASAREAARSDARDRDAILARRRRLRRDLADIPFSEDLEAAVSEHLAHIDSRLERLGNHPETARCPGLEILELRGDTAWLPLSLESGNLIQTLGAMEVEAEAVRPSAQELSLVDGGRVERKVQSVLDRVADVKRTRFTEMADRTGKKKVEDIWTAYLEARDLEVRTLRNENTDVELRTQAAALLGEMSPAETTAYLSRFAAEYEDISLDLLAVQAERPPAIAAEIIEEGRREMVWLRALCRDTMKRLAPGDSSTETRKELRKASSRLTGADRRLKREAQELRLLARQEAIFGRRAVQFFENLILWLILAVLVVLITEAVLPEAYPPEDAPREAQEAAARWRPVHEVLAWVDAGICAIFLIEFFGKLFLVRGRFSWFMRHFLVDLIPSIPYGLIVHQTFGALDTLRAGRVVRLTRVARLLRYVRVARPIVRFMRFFGFLQRGLDRLVRLHGSLLNRNILFFEPEQEGDSGGRFTLKERIQLTRIQARKAWGRVAPSLSSVVRAERLSRFLSGMPDESLLCALPADPSTSKPGKRHLRVEDLIQTLTQVDPGTIEAELGTAGARRIAATLDRLDAPLLRALPILRQLLPRSREGDALERVAAAAKALGRWIEKRLSVVHWVSDLSGVITGPQFLDRLGSGMVQATARPAKRLLMFGFAFLLLQGVVGLFVSVPPPREAAAPAASVESPVSPDDIAATADWKPPLILRFANWLERTLGTPFLVLGTFALVTLLLGTWFQRIAGEATDFYARTAEAQYINLLKSAKRAHIEEDIPILWDRVLRPEAVMREEEVEGGAARLMERIEHPRPVLDRSDRVLQLYHDYLDGALFHFTDTKTSSQLLGNLALEQIRAERLGTSKKERKRLRDLDLDRERRSFRGPYLWFRSVTHSVTQWSAKLILEYNRHAIPLRELNDYPAHVLTAMDEWLDRKIRGLAAEEEDAGSDDLPRGFVTTEFSALHFLATDPDRDRMLSEAYGEKVLRALEADRQMMIRTVFGTHPFHRLARADRTLNPFQLYTRYVAGGRVLLFPVYFIRGVAFTVRWFAGRIRATLREILNPSRIGESRKENWASYDVAVRKINRMRKPLYMECARFRAMFDPEYLGLDFHPGEDSGLEARTFREDLEGIGARDAEWDHFEQVRAARDAALVELEHIAAAAGGQDAFIESLGGGRDGTPFKECWRALAIAFAIDYRSIRSLSGMQARTTALIREVISRNGRVEDDTLTKRLLGLFLPSRALKTALNGYLGRFGPANLTPREQGQILRAAKADPDDLGRLIRIGAALEPGRTPDAVSRELMRSVVRHPETWSEQIVTLRTVQSLSVLDVRNYRRQVKALGGYE